jgi:hypothetical protein
MPEFLPDLEIIILWDRRRVLNGLKAMYADDIVLPSSQSEF